MKIKEIIQRIQSLYSKGVASDDSRLSNRHIYSRVLTTRARLIAQEAKSKQKVSDWNYQTIPCVRVIKVPPHECPCLPLVGCDILRSEHRLPVPITGLSSELIKAVTTIDRKHKIDEITMNAYTSQRGNRYTSKKQNYFIQDGYLYISTYTSLKSVAIVGLFEDPVEVSTYKGLCDCTDCIPCVDYLEADFYLDKDQIDTLVELCTQELLGVFNQSMVDLTNNANGIVKGQNK